jgi:hypothetical protein
MFLLMNYKTGKSSLWPTLMGFDDFILLNRCTVEQNSPAFVLIYMQSIPNLGIQQSCVQFTNSYKHVQLEQQLAASAGNRGLPILRSCIKNSITSPSKAF